MRSRRRCGTIALAFSYVLKRLEAAVDAMGGCGGSRQRSPGSRLHRCYYWLGQCASHVGDRSRGVGKNSRRISQWCINGRRCSTPPLASVEVRHPMGELTITRMAQARVPTAEGTFQLYLYLDHRHQGEHLAFVLGHVVNQPEVLVRVHSECFTGDVLGSLRCDCGEQLAQSIQLIGQEGAGIIIYLRQEGRGIGLVDKLRAYNLQDQGYDTVDANLLLGHGEDERDYATAAFILKDLGVPSIRLLTNNPLKIENLQAGGISVAARVPLPPRVTAENATYLLKSATYEPFVEPRCLRWCSPRWLQWYQARTAPPFGADDAGSRALRKQWRSGTSAPGGDDRLAAPGA